MLWPFTRRIRCIQISLVYKFRNLWTALSIVLGRIAFNTRVIVCKCIRISYYMFAPRLSYHPKALFRGKLSFWSTYKTKYYICFENVRTRLVCCGLEMFNSGGPIKVRCIVFRQKVNSSILQIITQFLNHCSAYS